MRRRRLYLTLYLLLVTTVLVGSQPARLYLTTPSDLVLEPISLVQIDSVLYLKAADLAHAFKVTPFVNPTVRKMVFRLNGVPFKITAENAYLQVQQTIYQLSYPTRYISGEIYLPLNDLLEILQLEKRIKRYHITRGAPEAVTPTRESWPPFSVFRAQVEERRNGTVVRFRLRPDYDPSNAKAWIHGRWVYLTLPNAQVDKASLEATALASNSTISRIVVDQLEQTAQVSLKVRRKVVGVDLFTHKDPPELLLSLRRPVTLNQQDYLAQQRQKWRLDKIVLDAGHGGIDKGAIGYGGLREKDITLDVVRRLGRLIEERTNIKVIYTRRTDRFVPLWERTHIANNSQGKIFVSVHVNASRNRKAGGFETYILRPGKTKEAIEVARLENSVIRLEKDTSRYKRLSDQELILATMAQSAFMRESEVLAELVQLEMGKRLQGLNRGVKQAGFIVLIGASMPNILVELGFITNPRDARLLRKASYRQRCAEAIFRGLMKFKARREKLLSEE